MDREKYRIVNLIQRFLLDDLSDEEREVLDSWRDKNEEHERLFRRVCQGENLRNRQKIFRELNALDAYKQFQCKTRKRWVNNVYRYAAIVCLPLLAVGIWMFVKGEGEKADQVVAKTIIMPKPEKQDKVILVLADGKKVGMTGIRQDSLRVGTAVAIGREDKLVYDTAAEGQDSIVADEPEMNKMITTSGGFYSLILSDGTRVWLNSESEFEYPVSFGKTERVVKLTGEAFFEVAKDASRPFVVETNDTRTRVLGTSFNIKAYRNEAHVAATLFTGKVEVTPLSDTTRRVVLAPGQQADWDLQAHRLSVRQVNLDHVMLWKEGLFLFQKENIEVVARQIERWYGVKFVYRIDSLERYTLNGYFSKDEPLDSILKIFTFTGGLEFEVKDQVVYVKENE